MTDIDRTTESLRAVNMFINFIDQTIATGLPMGTIQYFGSGDNNLYTYDPVEDADDPPPTVRGFIYVLRLCSYVHIMS